MAVLSMVTGMKDRLVLLGVGLILILAVGLNHTASALSWNNLGSGVSKCFTNMSGEPQDSPQGYVGEAVGGCYAAGPGNGAKQFFVNNIQGAGGQIVGSTVKGLLTGAVAGGTAGLFGGPLAPITVPVGAGIGSLVGAGVGFVEGGGLNAINTNVHVGTPYSILSQTTRSNIPAVTNWRTSAQQSHFTSSFPTVSASPNNPAVTSGNTEPYRAGEETEQTIPTVANIPSSENNPSISNEGISAQTKITKETVETQEPIQRQIPIQTFQAPQTSTVNIQPSSVVQSTTPSPASTTTSVVTQPAQAPSVSVPQFTQPLQNTPPQNYQTPMPTWSAPPPFNNYNYGMTGGIHLQSNVGHFEMSRPTFHVIRQ